MHKIGTSERPDWPLAVVIGAGGGLAAVLFDQTDPRVEG
jgi:hypothetical protein